jgi:hypothetical protein
LGDVAPPRRSALRLSERSGARCSEAARGRARLPAVLLAARAERVPTLVYAVGDYSLAQDATPFSAVAVVIRGAASEAAVISPRGATSEGGAQSAHRRELDGPTARAGAPVGPPLAQPSDTPAQWGQCAVGERCVRHVCQVIGNHRQPIAAQLTRVGVFGDRPYPI